MAVDSSTLFWAEASSAARQSEREKRRVLRHEHLSDLDGDPVVSRPVSGGVNSYKVFSRRPYRAADGKNDNSRMTVPNAHRSIATTGPRNEWSENERDKCAAFGRSNAVRRWISVCAAAGFCTACATMEEPVGPADGTRLGTEVRAETVAPVPPAVVDPGALSVRAVAERPEARVRSAPAARAASVPPGAEWLGEALEAEYAGVSASVALRQVTRGGPLRLEVGGRDPLVVSHPGATTVLDHVTSICAQADWACDTVGGVLIVSDMETKTLQVAAQPGSSSASLKLRALATGETQGSGGDSEDESGVEVELTPFGEEVAALVETVLGIGGEEDSEDEDEGAPHVDPRTGVVVLPSANAVLLTARPHMMRVVERELERFNAGASKTVRLHVAVYEVSSRDGSERGVDLLALRDAAVGFGLRVSGGSKTGSGAVVQVDFLEDNRAHGSQAVLRWLDSAGSARVSLNEVLEVRNNQVASVDATETRQFVAKVSQGPRTIGGGIEVGPPEIVFDELRLGWAVALQPTIVGDQVTVRVALSRRSLIEERPYRFAGGAIEGMNFVTDDMNRLMSVTLRSGQTKLLTSWVNATSRRTEEGVPFLGWLGRAGRREEREHEVVLLMSAEVL